MRQSLPAARLAIKSFSYSSSLKTGKLDIPLLSLIFGIAFFQCLGRLPLVGTDEARYMEIPREMLERGDFVTPTLNYVKYFEKPPLHYWANAVSTVIFGENAFAARFFGAVWGVLSVLMIYHVGRKLFGREKGLLAAMVLGTSIGYVVQSRVNITDTTLTFFLCAALGSFLLAAQRSEARKGLYYHLFYLFAALAVLAKGLIGLVFPGGIIFFFLLLTRRWRLLREMRLATGIPLFLLVAAPWFILVSQRNPEFLNFFFIHEHFQRFLTKVHHRYEPAWFFLPVLFGCMLPWSFFIPAATFRAFRERQGEDGEKHLFLLLWAAVIFAFFSASSSKLVPYILPVYPALALLIGSYLGDGLHRMRDLKVHGYAISAVHFICGIGLAVYPAVARSPKITADGAILVSSLFLAQGALTFINTRRGESLRLVCAIAVLSYATAIFAPPVFLEGIAKRKLSRDLALMVKEHAGKEAIVASFGYQQELPLYTGRRVLVVGSEGELEFGSKQGDQTSWFIDTDKFIALWGGSRQVFALVPKDSVESLTKRLRPAATVLGVAGPNALITNRNAS